MYYSVDHKAVEDFSGKIKHSRFIMGIKVLVYFRNLTPGYSLIQLPSTPPELSIDKIFAAYFIIYVLRVLNIPYIKTTGTIIKGQISFCTFFESPGSLWVS